MNMRIDPPGMNYTDRELRAYLRRSCEALNKILTKVDTDSKDIAGRNKKISEKLSEIQEIANKLISDSEKLEERCTEIEKRCEKMEHDIEQLKMSLL